MFITFRNIFGIYLFWHFVTLILYGEEVFGPTGMINKPELGPTHWFPNILNFIDAKFMIAVLALLCIFIHENVVCIILWYGWACLLNKNVFINNPGMGYIGWLLIVLGLGLENNRKVYFTAWFLMCLGYTASGLHKLQCPSWIDGYALKYVLENPIARDNFLRDYLLSMPDIVLKIQTWLSLALEISCLPLGMFYNTRKLFWFALFGLHIGIIAVINFTDLTLGVLMIQLFLFDPEWIPWK